MEQTHTFDLPDRPALQRILGNELENLFGDLQLEIDYTHEVSRPLCPEMEQSMYRLITGLINTSVKHRTDSRIRLHIWEDEWGVIHLNYHNGDGGFDSRFLDETGGGMELAAIHQRASAQGGFALVRTSPGEGFNMDLKVRKVA